MHTSRLLGLLAALALVSLGARAADKPEPGFTSLFDGKTLNGWTLVNKHGPGYTITNGVLACEHGGGGNLFTDKEYADFILRVDFRLEPGSNNGIGIRAPLEGDAAYMGMVFHFVSLMESVIASGQLTLASVHNSESLLAFLIMMVFMIVFLVYKTTSPGIVVFPLVFLLTFVVTWAIRRMGLAK